MSSFSKKKVGEPKPFRSINSCVFFTSLSLVSGNAINSKKSSAFIDREVTISFKQTSLEIYNSFDEPKKDNTKKKLFFDLLDNSFSTSEAKALSEKIGVCKKTLHNYLNDELLFTKNGHGNYKKVV